MDLNSLEYHVPQICEKCGCADLEYKGLGEYICNACGDMAYDDYGLVRNYIEAHKGASAPKISAATGVPIGIIRKMIEEKKFEFYSNRKRTLY